MSTVELDDIAARLVDGHVPTEADAEVLASTYDIVSLGADAKEGGDGPNKDITSN